MQAAATERSKTRILLIENDAWDASLVQEALAELEERPQDSLLPLPLDLFHADTVDDAVAAMRGRRSELILLDLAAHKPAGLHGFLKIRQEMPETPVVILSSREDEHLALAAMREGAAGYVLKEDMDCLPLARSLRAALDHHQAVLYSQHAAVVDEFTCMTSRPAFLRMAELVRGLSGKWGKDVALVRVELARSSGGAGTGEEAGEAEGIALLQTADMLRDVFPSADLAARTGGREFALLLTESPLQDDDVRRSFAAWMAERQGKLVSGDVSGYEIQVVNPVPVEAALEELLGAKAAARQAVAK